MSQTAVTFAFGCRCHWKVDPNRPPTIPMLTELRLPFAALWGAARSVGAIEAPTPCMIDRRVRSVGFSTKLWYSMAFSMIANFRLFLVFAAVAAHAQDLVSVPGGSYEVTDQITTVKVRVSLTDFLLGATEVTQKQYEATMSSNPSVYKGPDRPMKT